MRLILLSVLVVPAAQAAEGDDEAAGQLIEPQIERVEFDEAMIDASDFELGVYAGLLALEDFDTNGVVGIRFAYHVSEDFFVQAVYGLGSSGETSYERLSVGAQLLEDDERDVEYYLIGLGYNLFPGEAFPTDNTTFNTVLYLSAGVGSTTFAGDDRFTLGLAVGHRTLFADWFSFDIEMRDLMFEMDVFGDTEMTHNLEFLLSFNGYF